MIKAGIYTAKLRNYGIKLSGAGKPQIACQFQIIEDEQVYNLTWYGSFTEKATDNTIKTLCGVMDLFAEPSEVEAAMDRIAEEGVDSGLLNMDKEYSLVVEHDEYNGKTNAKIRWVNNVGSGQTFEKLAKGMFSGMNLGGAVAAFKAANPSLAKKKEDMGNVPF